jgi:HK97 gp10 family phage protein
MGIDRTEARIRGITELRQSFDQLRSRKEVETVALSATRSASRLLLALAKDNARRQFHEHTGATLRNIARVTYKRANEAGYGVGVRYNTRKQRKTGDNPYYWWFHEFGYRSRSGTMVPARPFLGPAYKQLQGQLQASIYDQAVKAVLAAADRAQRRRR